MPKELLNLRRTVYCYCMGFAMVGALERDFIRRTGRGIWRQSWRSDCSA